MEDQRRSSVGIVISKKVLLITIATLIFSGLAIGGLFLWKSQPRLLLPQLVAKQATRFVLYFYYDEIPAGYSFNQKDISFSDNILMVPFTKTGVPTVVLTEQPLPNNLPKDLLKEGDEINISWGSATINKINGHLIVTILASKSPQTLILLTTSDANSPAELTALLQGLRPTDNR